MHLDVFGSIWTNLDGQVWVSLDTFRQFWMSLDEFGSKLILYFLNDFAPFQKLIRWMVAQQKKEYQVARIIDLWQLKIYIICKKMFSKMKILLYFHASLVTQ